MQGRDPECGSENKTKIASPAARRSRSKLFAATLALAGAFFYSRSTIAEMKKSQGERLVRGQEGSVRASSSSTLNLTDREKIPNKTNEQQQHQQQQQQQPHETNGKRSKKFKSQTIAVPKKTCELEGSFVPPGDEIIIDYEKIRNMDLSLRERLKHLTIETYEKFFLEKAGKEHYAFMSYMSDTYGDCRHFTDIGTRYVTSSLAIGSNLQSPVWTFDRPGSTERKHAFRGKTEAEWKSQAQSAGVDITFHNLDLLAVPDEEFRKYFGTWFVFLDTFHYPDTKPFERELFQRIRDVGFKGILGLDDIYLNDEMKKWWNEVREGAEAGGYTTYDITEVGHFSGTGLVDFSGKVTVRASK